MLNFISSVIRFWFRSHIESCKYYSSNQLGSGYVVVSAVWVICKLYTACCQNLKERSGLLTLGAASVCTEHGGCASMQVLSQLHQLRSSYTQLLPEDRDTHTQIKVREYSGGWTYNV